MCNRIYCSILSLGRQSGKFGDIIIQFVTCKEPVLQAFLADHMCLLLCLFAQQRPLYG